MSASPGTRRTLSLESAELREAIIAAVRDGIPLTTAVRLVGLDLRAWQSWFYAAEHGKWKNDAPVKASSLAILVQFEADIRQAQAEFEAEMTGKVVTAARESDSPAPAQWLLMHHQNTRENWNRPKTEISIEDSRSGRPSIREKTTAELVELAGDQYRYLLEDAEDDDVSEPTPPGTQ